MLGIYQNYHFATALGGGEGGGGGHFDKTTTFIFFELSEFLQKFVTNAKIYSEKFIFRRFRVNVMSENFLPLVCKQSKTLPKVWPAKIHGLEDPASHPYPSLHRSGYSRLSALGRFSHSKISCYSS